MLRVEDYNRESRAQSHMLRDIFQNVFKKSLEYLKSWTQ